MQGENNSGKQFAVLDACLLGLKQFMVRALSPIREISQQSLSARQTFDVAP